MFFVQVVRGRPSGHLQFSGGGSKIAWLASAFSSIRARCPKESAMTGLANEYPGFFVGTIGPLHQPAVYPPCLLPSIQIHKAVYRTVSLPLCTAYEGVRRAGSSATADACIIWVSEYGYM